MICYFLVNKFKVCFLLYNYYHKMKVKKLQIYVIGVVLHINQRGCKHQRIREGMKNAEGHKTVLIHKYFFFL